jgi:uncharacterized protein (TIGR02246 family)
MNMRQHMLIAALCAAPWLGAFVALAEEGRVAGRRGAADASKVDLEEQVRANAAAFVEAYNRQDAKAIAGQFAAQGEFVDQDGNVFTGPEAIGEEFAAFFEAFPEARLELEVESVRQVAASVAVEEGVVVATSAPTEATDRRRYLAVHTLEEGQWRIATTRSLEADAAVPREQLAPLAWLVGDWVDESDEAKVATHVAWSDDESSLIGRFEVEVQGRPALSGTYRIGWDPAGRKIRSWVFDSAGGHAEGVWTRVDDAWVVKMTGVTSDGESTSATMVYARLSEDAYLWRAVDRVIGDEALSDVEVKVVRRPPEPAAKRSR